MGKTDEIKVVELSNTQGRALMDVFTCKNVFFGVNEKDLENFFYDNNDIIVLTEDMEEGKSIEKVIIRLLHKLQEKGVNNVNKLLVNVGTRLYADEPIDLIHRALGNMRTNFEDVEMYFSDCVYNYSDDGRISLIATVG